MFESFGAKCENLLSKNKRKFKQCFNVPSEITTFISFMLYEKIVFRRFEHWTMDDGEFEHLI